MHRKLPLGAVAAEPRVPAQCHATDLRRVKSSAARLRRQVSWWIGNTPAISDHIHWMNRNGFEREDIRQIRYAVEVFYNCEPIFAITHALGARIDSRSTRAEDSTDPNHLLAPDALKAGLLQTPAHTHAPVGMHAFFRILAAWPCYGEMVSHEMLMWHALPELVTSTLSEACYLASRIPIPDASGQRFAAHSDKLLASCEVLVVCAALRQMFINCEVEARTWREMQDAFGCSA